MNSIDRLLIILDSQVGKESQFANVGYEAISLINSILAMRATPHPLM
jgi:hypothetical protein